MNASLERARDRMNVRTALVGEVSAGGPRTGVSRHPELQLAYAAAGQNAKGPILYFKVLYCPDCLRGTTTELVREMPAGLPNAHDLGVKRARHWSMECNA